MKNKFINSILILVAAVPLVLIVVYFIQVGVPLTIPPSMTGYWTGNQKIRVRSYINNAYIFHSSPGPVLLQLKISAGGRVEGRLGTAFLQECAVVRNRGWITRLINFSADYMISGKLAGPVFPGDTIPVKGIRVPFYQYSDLSIDATIFQSKGYEIFPMADIHLVKDKSQ